MVRKLLAILLALAIIAAFTTAVMAEEKADAKKAHDFIGAKKCKMCHKQQYASWEKTKMAKALDLLKPEEQKDPKCAPCHMTGTSVKGVLLEGVQCEACHGAGADYKKKKIMKDKKLAMENGLMEVTEEVCLKCHIKEGNPNYKEFDFAKAIKNDIHEHFKPKEETKK